MSKFSARDLAHHSSETGAKKIGLMAVLREKEHHIYAMTLHFNDQRFMMRVIGDFCNHYILV